MGLKWIPAPNRSKNRCSLKPHGVHVDFAKVLFGMDTTCTRNDVHRSPKEGGISNPDKVPFCLWTTGGM